MTTTRRPTRGEVARLVRETGIVDGTGTLYTVCEQALSVGEGTPERVREIWAEATRDAEADLTDKEAGERA